jgi:hypothetical protein
MAPSENSCLRRCDGRIGPAEDVLDWIAFWTHNPAKNNLRPQMVDMAFCAYSRWGGSESNPSIERLRELLQSLDINDPEHPDVALKHETEWCLSAFRSGLLVWENVEADADNPRHMTDVPREKVLCLWVKLAQGDIAAVEAEPWLTGCG